MSFSITCSRPVFFYFWYAANPTNGLVPDRSAPGSACSIAAVGFGLTAIGIAADHGWITRTQAVTRVLATLNTFWQGPQGPATTGVIGYNGWFLSLPGHEHCAASWIRTFFH
jgi:hypothetical protein